MDNQHMYDIIIVGGGPAGYTAALYAARAGLDTIVLEKLSAGGQMALTSQIDNYPGFEDGIDGFLLAEKMEKKPEKCPRIYIACGTEDHLFNANERFVERFGKSLNVEYHTQPGTHSWLLWNEDIRRVLEWLGLEKAV